MMLGGGGGDGLGLIMNPAPEMPGAGVMVVGGLGGGGGVGRAVKEERVPQWSAQETRDFIMIRAELERDFTLSKRNKTLWEVVAGRMREQGYRRSPEQCKCKWKNLVNRYKGKEASDPENGRHCPFFEELHAVFTERARNMQNLLVESESRGLHSKKKLKRSNGDRSSDDLSEDDEEDEEDSDEDRTSRSKKKKLDRGPQLPQQQKATDKSKTSNTLHDLLQEFLQQQLRTESQWLDMMERRGKERRMFEQEFRQAMEKIERDRLMLDQAWREREEQRRIREETRAEKRDKLLTTLLNKLIQDEP